MAADRRRALGALGEGVAARHLAAQGYAVVDRNFRTRYGELDLVAADDRFLVFCEVKTRILRGQPGPFGPLAGVGAGKQRRLRLMARQWLGSHAEPARRRPAELRFDVVGVLLDRDGGVLRLEHIENAF
jgi:putative endonuclease